MAARRMRTARLAPTAAITGKETAIMIKLLHRLGVTSDVAYLAALASIGASVAAWGASRSMENAAGDRADRWGIYVGLWAPTFMALGSALKIDEKR
jgi:hypothetical protein